MINPCDPRQTGGEKTIFYDPVSGDYNDCGPIKFKIELSEEKIAGCCLQTGGAHRGIEKTVESRRYNQVYPWLEKSSGRAGEINNLGYVLAVEKLLELKIPGRVKWIRTIISEIYRINSHLNWLADFVRRLEDLATRSRIDAITVLVEKIISSLKQKRGTSAFIRIGGLRSDIPPGFHKNCRQLIAGAEKKLPAIKEIIFNNPFFLARTKNLGELPIEPALEFGTTGPDLRASGVNMDIRKTDPYSMYDRAEFLIPVGKNGDTYDRSLVRLEEISQSLRIIEQALEQVTPTGIYQEESGKINLPGTEQSNISPEVLIHHYNLCRNGFKVPAGEVYRTVESPRGELGFFIVADGSNRPYRCHIRPPSAANGRALIELLPGRTLDEAEIIIDSFDICPGGVNR